MIVFWSSWKYLNVFIIIIILLISYQYVVSYGANSNERFDMFSWLAASVTSLLISDNFLIKTIR